MKFQNPSIHHSKVNTHTDRHTDRQAESNMPFQLFQSWGHNNVINFEQLGPGVNKSLGRVLQKKAADTLAQLLWNMSANKNGFCEVTCLCRICCLSLKLLYRE